MHFWGLELKTLWYLEWKMLLLLGFSMDDGVSTGSMHILNSSVFFFFAGTIEETHSVGSLTFAIIPFSPILSRDSLILSFIAWGTLRGGRTTRATYGFRLILHVIGRPPGVSTEELTVLMQKKYKTGYFEDFGFGHVMKCEFHEHPDKVWWDSVWVRL